MYSSKLEDLLKSFDVINQEPVKQKDPTHNLIDILQGGAADLSKILGNEQAQSYLNIGVISEPKSIIETTTPIPFNQKAGAKKIAEYFASTAAKKIVLISTHAQEYTGYSKVSWNIIKILSEYKEFEIFHYGIRKQHSGAEEFRTYPSNVKVQDVAAFCSDDGYGFANITKYINEIGPDVVIIYNDIATIKKYVENIELCESSVRSRLKLCAYLDVKYTSMPYEYVRFINIYLDHIFVFNKEWMRLVEDFGVKIPISVFEYGIDISSNEVMYKSKARKSLNLPTDAFIILAINQNTQHNRFDIIINAFTEVVCKHPSKKLFLFCITDSHSKGGYNIQDIYTAELLRRGVQIEQHVHKIMITNESNYTDEIINYAYSATDIGINCADAEGFGLSQLEMMSLYRPQIMTSHPSFSSYADASNSIILPTKYSYYVTSKEANIVGRSEAVCWVEVANAIERYLMDSDLVKEHGSNARREPLRMHGKM